MGCCEVVDSVGGDSVQECCDRGLVTVWLALGVTGSHQFCELDTSISFPSTCRRKCRELRVVSTDPV